MKPNPVPGLRRYAPWFCVLLPLLLILLIPNNNPYEPKVATARFVGADFSDSMGEQDWTTGFKYVARLCAGLVRGRDQLRLYAIGQTTTELASEIPARASGMEALLKDHLEKLKEEREGLPVEKRTITRPALFFEQVAKWLQDNPSAPFSIEIDATWDGGDEDGDQKLQTRYDAAADVICTDPRVAKLVIWGVRPGSAEKIRRMFGRLGQRLVILPRGEVFRP